MSSSDETSAIFLKDSEKEVEKKIMKYAFSGGRDTVEEHRELGGNPDIDVCFQYLKFMFEEDDKKLANIEEDYRSGKMLTSELKKITIGKINAFLREHQKRRAKMTKKILERDWLWAG
jgi:tryptophanyl-tRNA synthetase